MPADKNDADTIWLGIGLALGFITLVLAAIVYQKFGRQLRKFFRGYIYPPSHRDDHLEIKKFDVTRLATWSTVRLYGFALLVWLVLVEVVVALGQYEQWGPRITQSIWILNFLLPCVLFVFFSLATKGTEIKEYSDHFPRYHTLKYYQPFILVSGLIAASLVVVSLLLGHKSHGTGWVHIGLFFNILIAASIFWVACSCAKTKIKDEILSARKPKWSEEREQQQVMKLISELQRIEKDIEKLEKQRGRTKCEACDGKGRESVETDPESPGIKVRRDSTDLGVCTDEEVIEGLERRRFNATDEGCREGQSDWIALDKFVAEIVEVCPSCKGEKTQEWKDATQKSQWDTCHAQQTKYRAELAEIEDVDVGKPKSLNFRFPWFTETGHAKGDKLPASYSASEERRKKFAAQNEDLFSDWLNLDEGTNHSETYAEKIGMWGTTYVSNKKYLEDSREVKTLSSSLYDIVREHSLSELQQVELCLAAVQSITLEREDVPHPPLECYVLSKEGAYDSPKVQRLKAIITHLWEIAGTDAHEMTREEEEFIIGKIQSWHISLQKTDDDDPDGELKDFQNYFNKLCDWFNDGAKGKSPAVDHGQISTETLSPAEHIDLLNEMEALNKLSIEKYPDKYNAKLLRISHWRSKFNQADKIFGDRKKFDVRYYPKFPTEMLCDEKGTCDDAALLLATLLHYCGYRTRLYRYSQTDPEKGKVERMGVAVEIEGSDDTSLFGSSNVHKGMIYCEATPDDWYCNEIDISEKSPVDVKVDEPEVEPELEYEF